MRPADPRRRHERKGEWHETNSAGHLHRAGRPAPRWCGGRGHDHGDDRDRPDRYRRATGTIADLPGPDGLVSFSEAMIAANNTPGADTIAFAIPRPSGRCSGTCPAARWCWDQPELECDRGGDHRRHDADRVHRRHQSWRRRGRLLRRPVYFSADNCVVHGWTTPVRFRGFEQRHLGKQRHGHRPVRRFRFAGPGQRGRWREDRPVEQQRRRREHLRSGARPRMVRRRASGDQQPDRRARTADRNVILGLRDLQQRRASAGATRSRSSTRTAPSSRTTRSARRRRHGPGPRRDHDGTCSRGPQHQVRVRNNRIAGIIAHGSGPHSAARDLDGHGDRPSAARATGFDIVGNTIGLDANGDRSSEA